MKSYVGDVELHFDEVRTVVSSKVSLKSGKVV